MICRVGSRIGYVLMDSQIHVWIEFDRQSRPQYNKILIGLDIVIGITSFQDHPKLVGTVSSGVDPLYDKLNSGPCSAKDRKNSGRAVRTKIPGTNVDAFDVVVEFQQGHLETLFEILEYDAVVGLPMAEAVIMRC